jgi:hypothetical protein
MTPDSAVFAEKAAASKLVAVEVDEQPASKSAAIAMDMTAINFFIIFPLRQR